MVKHEAPPISQASRDRVDPSRRVVVRSWPYPRCHRSRDHVDSCAEEGPDHPDVVVGVSGRRPVVGKRIGRERHELVDVARGDHADRADPAQLSRVAAGLLRLVHADPHELEIRMTDDLGDHHLPDEPCPPHDHSLGALDPLCPVRPITPKLSQT